MFWTAGQVSWFGLPEYQASHEASCRHRRPGVATGMTGCDVMQAVLTPGQPLGFEPLMGSFVRPPDLADRSQEICALLSRFCNIGDNAECGVVQRLAGLAGRDLFSSGEFSVPNSNRLVRLIGA